MGLSVEQQRQKVRDLKPVKELPKKRGKHSKKRHFDNRELDAVRSLAEQRVLELYDRPTKSEQKLIKLLERQKIPFVFQELFIKGTRFYIVDFYIKGLIIELDGKSHKFRRNQDFVRTQWLLKRKEVKKLIRFKNHEVFDSPYMVIGTILDAMKRLKITKEGC